MEQPHLARTFNAILEGTGLGARLFNNGMFLLISIDILIIILETVPGLPAQVTKIFLSIYGFSMIVFIVEYVLRIWSCVEQPMYSGRPIVGRLMYLSSPSALVDLLVILSFSVPLIYVANPLTYEFIKFARLFIIFKLVRYSSTLQAFSRIIVAKRKPLTMVLYILFFLLIVSSTFMYFIEHDAQPEKFSSVPASMWWAVITLTTVGYGDIYPITPLGKFLGGIMAILAIGMFALPAGILSSGFWEEYVHKEASAGKEEGEQSGKDLRPEKKVCPHCGQPLDEPGQTDGDTENMK
jgi:voltage-gated potassium channel